MLMKFGIVFNLGFSLLWLKEKLSKAQGVGALLGIVGTLVIASQPSELLRLGSLIVLSVSFFYSLHVAIAKKFLGQIRFLVFFSYN